MHRLEAPLQAVAFWDFKRNMSAAYKLAQRTQIVLLGTTANQAALPDPSAPSAKPAA